MTKQNKAPENLMHKIINNVMVRNMILAVCAILALAVVSSLLLYFFTRHNKYIDVPDFTKMDIEEARSVGRKASLRLEVNDSLYVPAYPGGVVLEQMPAAGTEVKPGRRIFVTLNSFRQKMVDVPYVAGYSLRQAKNNLELAGLEIDKIVYVDDMATNNVIEQQYKGRTISPNTRIQAERGSGITLIVGWNPESRNPAVPKVVGFSLKEAKSRLWEAGFNLGKVTFDNDISMFEQIQARVYKQTPVQGSRIVPGGSVSLMLTLDPEKLEKGNKESDKDAKAVAKQQEEQMREEAEATADQ